MAVTSVSGLQGVARRDGFLFNCIGRYILMHWPLLWRSRLPMALLLAPAGWGLAFALSLLIPAQPETVLVQSQIDLADFTVTALAVLCCALWARLQLRYQIGEQRLHTHLKLATYNAIGLFALLSAAAVFQGAVSSRVSRAMSHEELQRHLEYHRHWDFWMCSPKITADAVAEQMPQLSRSLERFGMLTHGRVEKLTGPPCDEARSGPSLVLVDKTGSDASVLLRDRLLTLARHQSAGNGSFSHVVSVALRHLDRLLGLVAIGTTIVGTLNLPTPLWSRWRRRLLTPGGRRRWSALRPWKPLPLHRLDRRLLLNRPDLWAYQLHTFAYHALLAVPLIATAVGVSRLTGLIAKDNLLKLSAACYLIVVACYAVPFWVRRFGHFPVPFSRPAQWRRLALAVALTLTPFFVVAISSIQADQYPENIIAIAIIMLPFVASIVYVATVANLLPKLATLIGWALGFAMLVFVVVNRSNQLLWLVPTAWLVIAGGLTVAATASQAAPGLIIRLLANLLLASELAALFGLFILAGPFMLRRDLNLVNVVVSWGLYGLVHFVLVRPALHLLARFRYWPRPD